jgi:hypothetical protein
MGIIIIYMPPGIICHLGIIIIYMPPGIICHLGIIIIIIYICLDVDFLLQNMATSCIIIYMVDAISHYPPPILAIIL